MPGLGRMGLFRPRVHTLQATHPSILRGVLVVACCRIGTFRFIIRRPTTATPDGVQLVQVPTKTSVQEEEMQCSELDPPSVLQGDDDCAQLS